MCIRRRAMGLDDMLIMVEGGKREIEGDFRYWTLAAG
jgi:hypothetical protein